MLSSLVSKMEFHGQEGGCQCAGVRTRCIRQASPGLPGCEHLGDKDRADRIRFPQEGGWGDGDEGVTGRDVSVITGVQASDSGGRI